MHELFRHFASRAAAATGSPLGFLAAIMLVIVWATLGQEFSYSANWQLFINTSTTIVTFLMVFLIQSTQNRDSKAIHLKLDELLRAVKGARVGLIDMDQFSDEELAALEVEFKSLQSRGHTNMARILQEKIDDAQNIRQTKKAPK